MGDSKPTLTRPGDIPSDQDHRWVRIRHEARGTLASVRRLLRQRGQFLLDDAPAAQERLVALMSIGPVGHGVNRYEPVGHRANSVEWIGVTVRAN
jgi:hypothetical protein